MYDVCPGERRDGCGEGRRDGRARGRQLGRFLSVGEDDATLSESAGRTLRYSHGRRGSTSGLGTSEGGVGVDDATSA